VSSRVLVQQMYLGQLPDKRPRAAWRRTRQQLCKPIACLCWRDTCWRLQAPGSHCEIAYGSRALAAAEAYTICLVDMRRTE
jgi:hypothetical protein